LEFCILILFIFSFVNKNSAHYKNKNTLISKIKYPIGLSAFLDEGDLSITVYFPPNVLCLQVQRDLQRQRYKGISVQQTFAVKNFTAT
jgi:hypothetical protein